MGPEVLEDTTTELGGTITQEIIFPSPALAEVGMSMARLQAGKQDPKHCQARYILRLHGSELSLSWVCNV